MLHFHQTRCRYNNVRDKFPFLCEEGRRLLNHMFLYDTSKRATATECLQSTYFQVEPHGTRDQNSHLLL